MNAMPKSITAKIPIILGVIVFLVVIAFGFWFMTKGPSCVDVDEANLGDRVVVVVGSDGNCYYTEIGG